MRIAAITERHDATLGDDTGMAANAKQADCEPPCRVAWSPVTRFEPLEQQFVLGNMPALGKCELSPIKSIVIV